MIYRAPPFELRAIECCANDIGPAPGRFLQRRGQAQACLKDRILARQKTETHSARAELVSAGWAVNVSFTAY